jgi:hypothetical protein
MLCKGAANHPAYKRASVDNGKELRHEVARHAVCQAKLGDVEVGSPESHHNHEQARNLERVGRFLEGSQDNELALPRHSAPRANGYGSDQENCEGEEGTGSLRPSESDFWMFGKICEDDGIYDAADGRSSGCVSHGHGALLEEVVPSDCEGWSKY